MLNHRLQMPREEIAQPKLHSHSQIFRYSQGIFCLPHRPNFSDIFDLCLHWVSVVRDFEDWWNEGDTFMDQCPEKQHSWLCGLSITEQPENHRKKDQFSDGLSMMEWPKIHRKPNLVGFQLLQHWWTTPCTVHIMQEQYLFSVGLLHEIFVSRHHCATTVKGNNDYMKIHADALKVKML